MSNLTKLALEQSLKRFLLKKPLDKFFENVMVMVEDEKIRNNRISLLYNIKKLGEKLFIANKIVN